MLKSISWNNYIYFVGMSCGLYYLAAGIYFYKNNLLQLLKGKSGIFQNNQSSFQQQVDGSISEEDCINEIYAYCEQIKLLPYEHISLLNGLRAILNKYKDNTKGRLLDIKDVLRFGLEKRCSIYLSNADMDWLWRGFE